jgi:ankyrin repeat protein
MLYKIKYRTKDNIRADEIYNLSHSDLVLNDNIVDLTHFGKLTNLVLPDNLLATKEPIKLLAKFNIWFKNIENYKLFLDKVSKDLNLESINTEENLDQKWLGGYGKEIKKIDNLISYAFNSDYPYLKFGKIEYFKYNPIDFCADLSCVISEDVIGNQLLFLTQKGLMNLCSEAIREHDNQKLIELLEFSENIDQKNRDDNGLYFVAAWNSNVEALKILKEKGTIFEEDINISGARSLSVLKYLKENNILNVNFKDENGFNPLQQTCVLSNNTFPFIDECDDDKMLEETVKERLKCISFLVDEGVDINIKNKEGRNALMTAASQSNYDLSDKLIDLGIDCKATSKDGKIFTDYNNNCYYQNYYLFCLQNYSNLFDIYEKIKKEIERVNLKEPSIIETLFNNLYHILNLDNNSEEKIHYEFENNSISKNLTEEYQYFDDKSIYLNILPTDYFCDIVDTIYKEYKKKSIISEENLDKYNEVIRDYEKILSKKIFFNDNNKPSLDILKK